MTIDLDLNKTGGLATWSSSSGINVEFEKYFLPVFRIVDAVGSTTNSSW